ncbi:hypothetical protein AA0X95_16550 [Bacillus sp. 1P10SD]|uniref:hypothetical protein n=1 Tax=Bacillus sp. 1P10SD TaxID=3132265 RepID=UPI0039A4978C
MREIILEVVDRYQEKQGSSRKLLKIEKLERDVVNILGSIEQYERAGGYKRFYDEVQELRAQRILQELSKPTANWKKPSLHQTYWLLPRYTENEWSKVDIGKVLTFLDINFYLRHKKYQTVDEWEKISALYQFLSSNETRSIITREERSLMLFKNMQLPDEIEPEKLLASSYGQRLLSRLNLTPEDLSYRVVREPFHYWENKQCPEQHQQEVLVIEGLSTFETLKWILINGLPWNFGPIPHYVVWGEGYRISDTLDYLYELNPNPKELTIRYTGDLDYEGYNIYLGLKQRYKEWNISMAHAFYSFMISFIEEFAAPIHKNQRVVDRHLMMLQQEFKEYPQTFEGIQRLWQEQKRIPQECLNLETIFNKGGFD